MMTPRWSSGRGGKRSFYYQCTRNNRSVGTDCEARYLPAPAVETFVTKQVASWAGDEAAIAEAVCGAGKFREVETELRHLDSAVQRAMRERLWQNFRQDIPRIRGGGKRGRHAA